MVIFVVGQTGNTDDVPVALFAVARASSRMGAEAGTLDKSHFVFCCARWVAGEIIAPTAHGLRALLPRNSTTTSDLAFFLDDVDDDDDDIILRRSRFFFANNVARRLNNEAFWRSKG